jgi:hypothetical protein
MLNKVFKVMTVEKKTFKQLNIQATLEQREHALVKLTKEGVKA